MYLEPVVTDRRVLSIACNGDGHRKH